MPKTPRVKSVRVRRRRPTCFGCSLRGLQCHYGTLPGNCTECGQHKSSLASSDLNPHFRQVPASFSALVQQAHSTFPLQPDSSPNSTLRIHTTTVVDGSKGTHTLDVLGGSYSFEKQFRTQMDLLARQICFRNKKWTQPLTELCGAAVDARVYLAFLFASNVDERRRASRGEDDDDEVMHGNNLGLQLINFILSRLDEAIGVVMDGFENGQTENDEEYWADASIAAAILCKRLLSVHKDLVGECVRPFCGGDDLTAHLRDQVKSSADNLITSLLDRGLGCSVNIASRINAALDSLQYNIVVEKITLTRESHPIFLEATEYSPQASSATSFSPYYNPGMEQIPGAGILDERESLVALGSPDFYSVAASAQYSVSLPTSCSALSAMPYQAAQPPAWQTRVGPRYSPCLGPHGVPGFDTPSLDPSSLSSIQMTKHQPPAYKPTHHSYGPILPMPTNKTVPAFGDSWPDSATVHGFNPRSAPDYFGTDSFPQRNLQEEEFYSPLMSSYVSSADMFYPPPETSISMASQVLAPFWSEQYVTWRQS